MCFVFAVQALLCSPRAAAQDRIPPITAETLAKTTVSLPKDSSSRAAIVIFTFSKGAGDAALQWTKILRSEFRNPSEVAIFQVAVLEEVPRMFRGFVVRGIRKGTPQDLHNSFLVVFKDAAALKRYVGATSDEDPYLVAIDRDGNTFSRTSGGWSAEKASELRSRITNRLKHGNPGSPD